MNRKTASFIGRIILVIAYSVTLCFVILHLPKPAAASQTAAPSPRPAQVSSQWPYRLETSMRQTEDLVDKWLGTFNVTSLPAWYHMTTGQIACGEKIKGYESFYCLNEMTVYVTSASVLYYGWSDNIQLSEAEIASHEATHHLQKLAGDKGDISPAMERQAECGAGVFVRTAKDNGSIYVTDADILDMKDRMLDDGTDDVEHGSANLMTQAFVTGYDSGSLKACIPLAGPLAGV